MRLKLHVVPATVLAAGVLAGAAHGAPVRTDAGAQALSVVSPVASGPCGWRKGQWVCRAGRGTGDGARTPGDYYEHDANKLPFGTERWRDQMRRENRLGNPG
jgi:hypothetical protein